MYWNDSQFKNLNIKKYFTICLNSVLDTHGGGKFGLSYWVFSSAQLCNCFMVINHSPVLDMVQAPFQVQQFWSCQDTTGSWDSGKARDPVPGPQGPWAYQGLTIFLRHPQRQQGSQDSRLFPSLRDLK